VQKAVLLFSTCSCTVQCCIVDIQHLVAIIAHPVLQLAGRYAVNIVCGHFSVLLVSRVCCGSLLPSMLRCSSH